MKVQALIVCFLTIQATESMVYRRADRSWDQNDNGGVLVPETTHMPPQREPQHADEEVINTVEQGHEKNNRQILVPETTRTPPERTIFEDGAEYITSDGRTFEKVSSDPWDAFHEAMRAASDDSILKEGDIYYREEDRQASDGTSCSKRWPTHIKYAFHSSFDMSHSAAVTQSFDNWESNTCLTFEDISSDTSTQASENHIIIRSDSGGCWASLGMTCSTNGQDLNLGSGCIAQSVILHEIGHALGLFHEQSRTDRDSYVKILTENIQTGKESQFNIASTSLTFDLPYDYTSIMHYGRTFFSKDSQTKATIATLNPLMQFLIGSTNDLSHKDKAIVNKMYNCGSDCSGTCLNGGYFDNTCTCVCAPGFSGSDCSTGETTDPDPGYNSCGNQTVEGDGTIMTYNWPNSHSIVKCFWYLTPPSGKKAKVTFDTFDLYNHTAIDYVRVLKDLYNGPTYTGAELHGSSVTSDSDKGMILFWRTGYIGGSTGFSATVTMIDASGPAPSPTPSPGPAPSPGPSPTSAPSTKSSKKKKKNNKKKSKKSSKKNSKKTSKNSSKSSKKSSKSSKNSSKSSKKNKKSKNSKSKKGF